MLFVIIEYTQKPTSLKHFSGTDSVERGVLASFLSMSVRNEKNETIVTVTVVYWEFAEEKE